MKCPNCGAELIEVGYPDEIGFQSYRCPNDCKFKPPLSWKIWNAFGYCVWIAATISLLIIFAPFIIADYILDMKRCSE